MLDAMNMAGGAKSNFFPNSGPGSKTLIAGDAAHGYFGTVSTTDLFTAAEIEDFIYPLAGTVIAPTDFTWHKFVLDNKILFTPNRVIRNTSWATLYNAGLIYGIDGVGPYPLTTGGVNQLVLANKRSNGITYGFKIRTVEGGITDPLTALSNIDNTEYLRLLRSLTTGMFGTMAIALLDLNSYEETTTTYGANTNNNWVRLTTAAAQTNKTAAYNWRPVLELLPPSDLLFPAGSIRGRNSYLGEAIVATSITVATDLTPIAQLVMVQPAVTDYPQINRVSPIFPELVSAATVIAQSNLWAEARPSATFVPE